jgi:hypothetical protein
LSISFDGKDAGIQKVNSELKKFENSFIEEHGTNQLSVSEATFDSLYSFHQMQGTVSVGDCPYRNLAFSLEFECFPIVSIKITSDGGAGGVSWLGMTGSVFNLHTGYRLKLDDVIGVSKDIYLPIIFGKIFDYKQGYDKIYFSDYSDLNTSSRDEFIGTCLEKFDVNDFYLYDGGVVFIFQKYSIGPGAAGCPEFFVRFDQLKELKLIDQNFLKLLESSYYRRPGSQDE